MLRQITKTRKPIRLEYERQNCAITVEYGFDVPFAQRNSQLPYFHITADIKTVRGRWISGGCQHDQIERFFPRLRPLIRWHLFSFDQFSETATPLHYAANAGYWAIEALNVSEFDRRTTSTTPDQAFEHFKSTVAFGAVEGDTLPDCLAERSAFGSYTSEYVRKLMRAEIKREVSAWCAARHEALSAAFVRDMIAFNLYTPPTEEETQADTDDHENAYSEDRRVELTTPYDDYLTIEQEEMLDAQGQAEAEIYFQPIDPQEAQENRERAALDNYQPHTPTYTEEIELAIVIEGLNEVQAAEARKAAPLHISQLSDGLQTALRFYGNPTGLDLAIRIANFIRLGGKATN